MYYGHYQFMPRQELCGPLWWDEVRFGMFVHWGSCSVKGFEISWPIFYRQIEPEDYEALADEWNPADFRAEELVGLAKRTGMKYLVLTAKHHDGFCLFDSELTNYTSVKKAAKRDLVEEVVSECRRQGIVPCLYFSTCDWHHPDFNSLNRSGYDTRESQNFLYMPEDGRDDWRRWNRYVDYWHAQSRELLEKYGPLGIIFSDVSAGRDSREWRSREWYRMVKTIQPDVLVNDRFGLPELADYVTPEQVIPGEPPDMRWETNMTVNDTWAYNPKDQNFKSAKTLVTHLCEVVAKGGNFLLNVGPDSRGKVQSEVHERFEEVGRWVERNGESIYGTSAGPDNVVEDGYCTSKGHRLFVHIPAARAGRLLLQEMHDQVWSVHALGTGRPLKFSHAKGSIDIELPGEDVDPLVTVLEINLRAQGSNKWPEEDRYEEKRRIVAG